MYALASSSVSRAVASSTRGRSGRSLGEWVQGPVGGDMCQSTPPTLSLSLTISQCTRLRMV
jgi:hypothetical protein